jgi:hypothetical protein
MLRWKTWVGLAFVVLALSVTAAAQSGAITGLIQGTVSDSSGFAVAGARVMLVNADTGLIREASTEADGLYRFPLLPLGNYTMKIEAAGFNKFEQSGLTITGGSTVTVDVIMRPGEISESIVISAAGSITEPGRVDIGATVNERSVTNLPLVSRNVYNFILLQPNVSAHPNTEFGVPRKINANGFTDRIDYQLDGGNNTESDRKGIRLMPISQTFVREIVEATNGYAPEFGNTTGTVFNAVTNSGTNEWHGSANYIFRRPEMTARPSRLAATAPKPDLRLDDPFGTIGGPIIRDRLHFFASYEKSDRNLPSVITVTAADAARIGIPLSDLGSVPFAQHNQFVFARVDWQINDKHRLMGRYMYFRNDSPNNPNNSGTQGGLKVASTASTVFVDRAHAVGIQLISTFNPTMINEFRFHLGYRNEVQAAGPNTPTGPHILISGIAAFGGPDDLNPAILKEKTPEFVDNLTLLRGRHNLKFGGSIRPIFDNPSDFSWAQYTFPDINSYLAAKSGTNPKSYSSFQQTIGDPRISFTTTFYGFFAQDSWAVTPQLNITYGLRYDIYVTPKANPSSTLPVNQDFRTDKNNFAPRFGAAYSLGKDHKTVIRASAAIFYDTPQTDFYRRAILINGNVAYFNANIPPTSAIAPAFPNVFTSAPAVTLGNQDVAGVSPDFRTLYSINTNIMVTRELSSDMALTVGYLYTKGTGLPIARNINFIRVLSRLPDGRPVFSTAAVDRLYPQFNNIYVDESVGNSNYNGFSVSLNKRFAHDFQLQANYLYSHAIDDAPEENSVDSARVTQSDPTDRSRDRGSSLSDRRHIFTFSGVWEPTFQASSQAVNYLINHNQLGFIVNTTAGEPYNITANRNLLGYAEPARVSRPNFIGRNTFSGTPIAQVDLRYSRFIPLKSERYKIEVLGEFTNLFNHTNVSLAYNLTQPVDTLGNPTPAPGTFGTSTTTRDPRYFQLGFKFLF